MDQASGLVVPAAAEAVHHSRLSREDHSTSGLGSSASGSTAGGGSTVGSTSTATAQQQQQQGNKHPFLAHLDSLVANLMPHQPSGSSASDGGAQQSATTSTAAQPSGSGSSGTPGRRAIGFKIRAPLSAVPAALLGGIQGNRGSAGTTKGSVSTTPAISHQSSVASFVDQVNAESATAWLTQPGQSQPPGQSQGQVVTLEPCVMWAQRPPICDSTAGLYSHVTGKVKGSSVTQSLGPGQGQVQGQGPAAGCKEGQLPYWSQNAGAGTRSQVCVGCSKCVGSSHAECLLRPRGFVSCSTHLRPLFDGSPQFLHVVHSFLHHLIHFNSEL